MSRFAAAVLSAVCLAFFSLSAAAAGQDAHRLRIGFTHFAPFVFVDDDGKLTGIDVELADAACRKLGCTTQFVPGNWQQKETILAHGDADCRWAGFSIDSRENLYQWTAPYLKSRQVVMVPQMRPVRRLSETLAGFRQDGTLLTILKKYDYVEPDARSI